LKAALKTAIHHIKISLRAKENFTRCDTLCPGKKKFFETTQILVPILRMGTIFLYQVINPEKKELASWEENKFKIRQTGYGG
jgi:hypothetical protein